MGLKRMTLCIMSIAVLLTPSINVFATVPMTLEETTHKDGEEVCKSLDYVIKFFTGQYWNEDKKSNNSNSNNTNNRGNIDIICPNCGTQFNLNGDNIFRNFNDRNSRFNNFDGNNYGNNEPNWFRPQRPNNGNRIREYSMENPNLKRIKENEIVREEINQEIQENEQK